MRVALGAQPADILRLVVGQGMRLTAIGLLAGLVTALAAARVLSSLLFGVGTWDPVTLLAVSGFLALVALVACYIPARSATRVDSMVALHAE